MKKTFYLIILSLIIFLSCDSQGDYTFIVRNSTQKTIVLKFVNEVPSYQAKGKETITLLPDEEKIVRIIYAPLNSPAHDCLSKHGIAFFNELIFDTYVSGEKLEKQLWQAENWKFHYKSKWSAEYSMTITNEIIER